MARRHAALSGPIPKNPAGVPADATTTSYRRRLSLLVGALLVQRADDCAKRSQRPQPPHPANESGRRTPTAAPSEAAKICSECIRGAPWAPGSTLRGISSSRLPRLLRCPNAHFFFLPCCAQAGDPFERAVRLQAIMDGLANVSKSTWRCACPPRAVAAARLLLPAGSRPARPARARACRARCAPAAWLSTAGVCPGWTCRAIFRLGTLSRGPSELRSLILHQRPQRRRCDPTHNTRAA